MNARALFPRALALLAPMFLLAAVASAGGPYQYYTLTPPCRVIDTRSGAIISGSTVRSLKIHGSCGVPTTAKAAALNFTVLTPSGAGHLVVWPFNTAQPGTSSMNWNAGETAIGNGAIAELTNDPNFNISVTSPVNFHLLIDVVGYYQ